MVEPQTKPGFPDKIMAAPQKISSFTNTKTPNWLRKPSEGSKNLKGHLILTIIVVQLKFEQNSPHFHPSFNICVIVELVIGHFALCTSSLRYDD